VLRRDARCLLRPSIYGNAAALYRTRAATHGSFGLCNRPRTTYTARTLRIRALYGVSYSSVNIRHLTAFARCCRLVRLPAFFRAILFTGEQVRVG